MFMVGGWAGQIAYHIRYFIVTRLDLGRLDGLHGRPFIFC